MKGLKLAKLRQHRRLTHKLEYNTRTDRWACKCGYVLGTGHDALYAQCPLSSERYIESGITQPQPKRERRPSKAALDLFDI